MALWRKKCCSVLLSAALICSIFGMSSGYAVATDAAQQADNGKEASQSMKPVAASSSETLRVLASGEENDAAVTVLTESVDGSEGNGENLVANLFDGDYTTKWLVYAAPSEDSPVWVSFGLSEAAAIRSYTLTMAAETDLSLYDRDPMAWTFEGSLNGEDWVVLDTRTRQQFTGRAAGANQNATYSFDNDVAYLYYKLNITSNTGSSNRTQLAELAVSTQRVAMPEPTYTDLTGLIDSETLTGSTETQQAAHDISHLIDGTPATKWLLSIQSTEASPVWASFALSEAAVVNRYTVTTAGDQSTRDPRAWTFEGSLNGEDWVVLDTRAGQTFSTRYEAKTFTFSNETAYTYYKLNITENNGATNRSHIAELSIGYEFIEIADWDYTPFIVGDSIDAATPQNTSQPIGNLFDDDVTTKVLFNITPSTDNPVFVTFRLSEAKAVSYYSLYAGIDGSGQFPRDPKAWTFEGSLNGEDWVVLDTRTEEDFYGRSDKLSLEKAYYFTNDTPYLYYKLNITANNGADNRTQIAEMKIGRLTEPESDPTDLGRLIDPDSIQSAATQQGTYLARYLFDGMVGTKCLFEVTPSVDAPIEITFALTEARTLSAYSISTAEDQSTFFIRDPRDWTLAGSTDGNEWVVLDTRTEQDFSDREDNTSSTKKYEIEGAAAYTFYRLQITANNGATNNRTQFAELQLYAPEPADYTDVDAAIAEIPSDLSIYTLETTLALQNAVGAVVRDLPAGRQEEVDAFAAAIRAAIAALREITVDMSFDISEGMVTNSVTEDRYDITWNAHILAGENTSYADISSQIQIKNYGVYYATSEAEISKLISGDMDALARMVSFNSGEDIDVYVRYGFRLKNVAPDRLRTVIFYLTYSYEGETYTVCSSAKTVSTYADSAS